MEDRVIDPRKCSMRTLKLHLGEDPELSNARAYVAYVMLSHGIISIR